MKKQGTKIQTTQFFRIDYPMYIQSPFGFIRNPTSSHSDSEHSLTILFKQVKKAVVLSCNFNF